MLVEYVNQHPYPITLVGPDGKVVKIPKSSRVVLSDYFMKYSPKFLQPIRNLEDGQSNIVSVSKPHQSIKPESPKEAIKIVRRKRAAGVPEKRVGARPQQRNHKPNKNEAKQKRKRKVVGRIVSGDATAIYRKHLNGVDVPISNNIGVGILSYNRLHCIRRLIESIRANTDLTKTTVFVSDESTDQGVKDYLKQQTDIVLIDNSIRLGIAGNTNRLLNCLRRFKYKLLLNDDVEILNNKWEYFYFEAMDSTNYHHFCYRQIGVYGANTREGDHSRVSNRIIKTIHDRPHGAVLALDEIAFQKVGYFDEAFGIYGMEHVDWSNRVGLSNIQPVGFHDVFGSDQYFKINQEPSATNKGELTENKQLYESFKHDHNRIRIGCSNATKVPEISIIIPCRVADRESKAIEIVTMNMKGQRFPHIDLILVEQDVNKKCNYSNIEPCVHSLAVSPNAQYPFTKAIAFNLGAALASTEKLILQDADCMMRTGYASTIYKILDEYEGCHIGDTVAYLNSECTTDVHNTQKLSHDYYCERAVGYFEGGSLACRRNIFFKVGGFNDIYEGYGCFDKQARVSMADGTTKSIADIVEGDSVITHTGAIKKVVATMSREYNGPAYTINLVKHSKEPFIITADHPIMASNNKTDKNWTFADSLSKNDLIARRRSHGMAIDIDSIDVLHELGDKFVELNGIVYPTRKTKYGTEFVDGRAIGFRKSLDVDDNLLDLIGYYAAEGCADQKNGIRFTVGEHEFVDGRIGHEICRILIEYGLNYTINNRGESKGRDIQTFCVTLAYLIKKWFPHTKNNKKFPQWVMNLPATKQARVLSALLKGDSQLSTTKNSVMLRMGNRNLVDQALFLAERCKCEPTHCSPSTSRGYTNYSMSIPHTQLSESIKQFINITNNRKPINHEYIIDNEIFHKIRNINNIQYVGIVYNITVEEDHSYIINGMIVKNCEDCDFFQRLKDNSKFLNDRSECLIHLWHGRSPNWDHHHKENRMKMQQFYDKYDRDRNALIGELRAKLRARYRGVMDGYGL